MSDLVAPLAAAPVIKPSTEPSRAPDCRPSDAKPYDSILDATGARKIIFDQGEVYCRVARYTDNSGNREFTCDGRRHNNRGLRQHLFEPRGPHRRFEEIMGILRPKQRNFHGPLAPCIFYPPSRSGQLPPQQHQQQYTHFSHLSTQNESLYHAHPGLRPFVHQKQQQVQPTHVPPSKQGFNRAPFSGQPPTQQWQQRQSQFAYSPARTHSTHRTHNPGQVLAQHSQITRHTAQNQGIYNGQHSDQLQEQQHQHQNPEPTYRPTPSQKYYHGHPSGQLPPQQQQQQQQQYHNQKHAQLAANQPNAVPYPASPISQDLYDLAWAAKLRSEQQQILSIQSGGRLHDFEIVIEGPPPPPSKLGSAFSQKIVIETVDETSNAAEAGIVARRNRDNPAHESVWIDAPEGTRILKCFWQRGELYVQPEDGYMFYRCGRLGRREEDVPVAMEVGTVICGCFQRDGELWVQNDPEGVYNRYGYGDEM